MNQTPTNVPDRRSFLAYFSGLGLSSTLFPGVLWAKLAAQTSPPQNPKPQQPASATITKSMLREAATVAGLSFTDSQLDHMLEGVNKLLPVYDDLRKVQLDNSVAPALYFNPILPGIKIDRTKRAMRRSAPEPVESPEESRRRGLLARDATRGINPHEASHVRRADGNVSRAPEAPESRNFFAP